MASILLVTADTSNLAYTRTKSALEGEGHTVAGSVDTTTALNTAWSGGSFDLIATVRINWNTSSDLTAAMGWIRDKWVAGTPVLVGGVEAGAPAFGAVTHLSERLGLTKDARVHSNASAVGSYAVDMRIRTSTHPITSGYTLDSLLRVNTTAQYAILDFFVGAQAGTEVGDIFGGGSDYGVYMTAVEAGDALASGAQNVSGETVAPARAALCGWLYGGQDTYTTAGKTVLGNAATWLATAPAGATVSGVTASITVTTHAGTPVSPVVVTGATASIGIAGHAGSFGAQVAGATASLTVAAHVGSPAMPTVVTGAAASIAVTAHVGSTGALTVSGSTADVLVEAIENQTNFYALTVDTFTRGNGRTRVAISYATITYAPSTPPRPQQPIRIMAQQLPEPTLVDGKPT